MLFIHSSQFSAIAALTCAVANIFLLRKSIWGMRIWLAGSILDAICMAVKPDYFNMGLFIFYIILAVVGCFTWKNNN